MPKVLKPKSIKIIPSVRIGYPLQLSSVTAGEGICKSIQNAPNGYIVELYDDILKRASKHFIPFSSVAECVLTD